MTNDLSRRNFLSYLAASPLFAGVDLGSFSRVIKQLQEPTLIPTARHALNVFDFEPVAKSKVPPAHWAYMATGSDDDGTILANREGFKRYELRMRRLVDVSKIDASIELLGK